MFSENAIEVTDLTKRYDGILAVDNMTFYVKKARARHRETIGLVQRTLLLNFIACANSGKQI